MKDLPGFLLQKRTLHLKDIHFKPKNLASLPKIITVVAAIIILMVSSCKFGKSGQADVAKAAEYPMIDSLDVFTSSIVEKYKPQPAAAAYAQKLLQQAEDMRLNKKDIGSSLPLYYTSLRLAPRAFTYLRYGDALFASADYERADMAYYFAALVDQSLHPEVYMRQARCAAMREDSNQTQSLLRDALEGYPFDLNQVKADRAFDRYHDREWFAGLMAKYNTDSRTRKRALMALLEKKFSNASLPYSIPHDSLYVYGSGAELDPKFDELIPDIRESFMGFDTWTGFETMVQLDLAPYYRSFIYRKMDYRRDTLNPVHHYIITIGPNDTMIAKQEIACGCSPFTIKTASIDKDGLIEVKEYNRTWQSDPLYHGYANNKVTEELKNTIYYQVNKNGLITAVEKDSIRASGQ